MLVRAQKGDEHILVSDGTFKKFYEPRGWVLKGAVDKAPKKTEEEKELVAELENFTDIAKPLFNSPNVKRVYKKKKG